MNLYDPARIPRSTIPENQEFPMLALSSWVTPENKFYIRNHFPYPVLPTNDWKLSIVGFVQHPIHLNYQALFQYPQITLPVTMECSGNKRTYFQPKTRGVQWEQGAVSHAIWTGVSLRTLLQAAGISPNAREVIFEGMDTGERTDLPGTFRFARSLPIEKSMHPDTLIALYMNGKPLPYKHGYPARLIVPNWYGMASVKWLYRIVATDQEFKGPFQEKDYVVYRSEADTKRRPVTLMKVNAAISQPTDQTIMRRGMHIITGTAWSGHGFVKKVEISLDRGKSWSLVRWLDPEEKYSWRRWGWDWHVPVPGTYHIMVKATDDKDNTQPLQAEWNVNGYENNSMPQIQIYVE
ncbi:Protein-methionine-sulfoxide reductase catalytic subunit MsrP [Paenibacillus allorhizoplanae]|uniref:Protein-methionine-sulfoxide reductase catalytic subunit MsrP n=2 Tax=Paenibacillus allorhizoplanae TaxID=2905648 RepID=A0ABN8H426_9BACL|nr:Protein-methionine-sulfoxide reductase catalytic subunit MsrP [Paenibacillus allorhizoplanae]